MGAFGGKESSPDMDSSVAVVVQFCVMFSKSDRACSVGDHGKTLFK